MLDVKWPLFLLLFMFKVIYNEASPWTVKAPSSIIGLPESCVVIPCSFHYPDPRRGVTGFTGIWLDSTGHAIFHTDASKIMQQFRGRTELLGDITQKNCSLKIEPLRQSDQGPFHFRIEMKDYEKFSYKANSVSITMIRELAPINLSVKEGVSGEAMNVSCSVSHSCPVSPPSFSWNHAGHEHTRQQHLDKGQWKATSTLTFHPTSADNNKSLQCTVTPYRGGQQQKISKTLIVKYAPMNVQIEYNSDVKEGEAVQLKCTSDANPASVYTWHNESGAQLHKGDLYVLSNVSRHIGALYCAAINTVGKVKSSPALINVLHAPEIKTGSSCASEGDKVKCVCIAESRPLSTVHFLLSDDVPSSINVETHGSVTIGTLQVDLGSSEFVSCVANNALGRANVTFILPSHNKMETIYIAIASGAVVIMVIIVVVSVQKCRGQSGAEPPPHVSAINTRKDVQLHQHVPAARTHIYDDSHHSSLPSDPIYGNITKTDWTKTVDDDAVYANV